MSQRRKLFYKIMLAGQDNNIRFDDVCNLLDYLGFVHRQSGTSHIVYSRDDYDGIINLQNKNGKCKAYQIAQLRKTFREVGIEDEDL